MCTGFQEISTLAGAGTNHSKDLTPLFFNQVDMACTYKYAAFSVQDFVTFVEQRNVGGREWTHTR